MTKTTSMDLPETSPGLKNTKSRRLPLSTPTKDECEDSSSTIARSESGESSVTKTIWALRFAIFADAVNSQILGPNYALMVMEDGHEVIDYPVWSLRFAHHMFFSNRSSVSVSLS